MYSVLGCGNSLYQPLGVLILLSLFLAKSESRNHASGHTLEARSKEKSLSLCCLVTQSHQVRVFLFEQAASKVGYLKYDDVPTYMQ